MVRRGTCAAARGNRREVDMARDNPSGEVFQHRHGEGKAIACEMPDEELLYDLADLFKVFADTTRIKLLYALMEGDLCVADLSEAVGVSQSGVSHQLRSLKQAHLVKGRREGRQIVYSLSDDHVHSILAQGLSHVCE